MADIQVLAVSSDPVQKSKAFAEQLGLKYPVACELQESQMRELGLYISDPKDYQPQDYRFSEPAYFVLDPSGKIRYILFITLPHIASDNRTSRCREYLHVHEYCLTCKHITHVQVSVHFELPHGRKARRD
jgi:peroxiredoxin